MEKTMETIRRPQWALVTGASSGMGLHYSRDLARRGYKVLMVSNQREELQKAADAIALEYKVETDAVYKDLASPTAAQELLDYALQKNYEVEVLVNNAGIFFFKDILDCPLQKVETMVNLHVNTAIRLCWLFGGKMRGRGKGFILNMSSISTHTAYCGISLYTATKSFLLTFTKGFHYEMKEYGVKVLAVCPGAVATDLYHLPKNLQELGVHLGVIYRPEKLTRRALDRLMKGKRVYIPGFINRFYGPIYALLPGWFLLWARKKIKKYNS